ncbi:hypothetical protein AAVH_20146, partial [Aphelenchoides avenae]
LTLLAYQSHVGCLTEVLYCSAPLAEMLKMATKAINSTLRLQGSMRSRVSLRALSGATPPWTIRDIQKGRGIEGVPQMAGQDALRGETMTNGLKKLGEKTERKGTFKEDRADAFDMAEKAREKARTIAGRQAREETNF